MHIKLHCTQEAVFYFPPEVCAVVSAADKMCLVRENKKGVEFKSRLSGPMDSGPDGEQVP